MQLVKMMKTNLLALACLSASYNAMLSSAACSRLVLQAALDDLFKTIEKSGAPSVKLVSTAKISKNNTPVKSITEAGLGKFSAWAKPFRITVLDDATCNVAAMSVPKYGNYTQILSTRMHITPTGEATELEIFVTGSDTNDIFFGDYLPNSPGEMWSAKNPAPRTELLRAWMHMPVLSQPVMEIKSKSRRTVPDT
jgi:hypothetical protein